MSVTVNTSGHLHDDFLRLLFLHAHREAGPLTGELPEVLCLDSVENYLENYQFLFSKSDPYFNLKP